MICEKCNSEVSADDKFCNNCGHKLKEDKQEIVMNICPSCETPNPEAGKYCVNCGYGLIQPLTPAKSVIEEGATKQAKESKPDHKRKINKVLLFWGLLTALFIGVSADGKMLLSLFVVIIGMISVLKPMKILGIKSRGKALLVAGVGIVILFFSAALLDPDVSTAPEATLSIDEFKAQSSTIPYDDLIRETEKYIGEIVHYTGKVVQVQESRSNLSLRVNVTEGNFGFYEDTLWVNYSLEEGERRIIEDDLISLWGEIKGRKTYTAVLGNRITIPEVNARKIEINND